MKQNPDEKLLFAGQHKAMELQKQAKKLLRLRDRKAFWNARKASPNGQQE